MPAPTVRPPSRIANRSPFSIAIGAINSISIATLSPGITISTPVRQMRHSRHVRRPEVELRPVAREERRVPSAFFLRQHIRFRLELRVRRDRARLRDYLSALDVLALHSAQQQPDVVSRHAFVQQLLEHLHARHHRRSASAGCPRSPPSRSPSPCRAPLFPSPPCRGPGS